MTPRKLDGLIVPIAVPLSPDGFPDRAGLTRLVEFLIAQGADAIFANGSMGGFAFWPDETQLATIAAVVELVDGRVPVLAGASDTATARVLPKIQAINKLSVDAVVLLPPYYYIHSQPELLRFFETAADASQSPLFLYENPRLAHNSLSVESIRQLAGHPNIRGVKYSTPDPTLWRALLDAGLPRDRFSLICGAGKLTNQALRMGFDGITEGLHNIIPNVARQLMDAARAADWDAASCLQEKINRCFRIFDVAGGWRGIEQAFRYMGISERAAPHPVDFEISAEQRSEIARILKEEEILIP